METAYKVHSMKSDDHKMWHLGWGSSSCPIPIYSSARSFIARMFIACLLCAGHWSSHWIRQWTDRALLSGSTCFMVQWDSEQVIMWENVRWRYPGEAFRQSYYGSQPEDRWFSVASLSGSGPALVCSVKDSNEGGKHMERKSYCSGFPLFKTS